VRSSSMIQQVEMLRSAATTLPAALYSITTVEFPSNSGEFYNLENLLKDYLKACYKKRYGRGK